MTIDSIGGSRALKRRSPTDCRGHDKLSRTTVPPPPPAGRRRGRPAEGQRRTRAPAGSPTEGRSRRPGEWWVVLSHHHVKVGLSELCDHVDRPAASQATSMVRSHAVCVTDSGRVGRSPSRTVRSPRDRLAETSGPSARPASARARPGLRHCSHAGDDRATSRAGGESGRSARDARARTRLPARQSGPTESAGTPGPRGPAISRRASGDVGRTRPPRGRRAGPDDRGRSRSPSRRPARRGRERPPRARGRLVRPPGWAGERSMRSGAKRVRVSAREAVRHWRAPAPTRGTRRWHEPRTRETSPTHRAPQRRSP